MQKMKKKSNLKNQRGQGLIEYLILVALIAVGTIGVVKAVAKTMTSQYAQINKSMGGTVSGSMTKGRVTATDLQQKDLSKFAEGQ
jgi:pilus assembly protein Flp/PilA